MHRVHQISEIGQDGLYLFAPLGSQHANNAVLDRCAVDAKMHDIREAQRTDKLTRPLASGQLEFVFTTYK